MLINTGLTALFKIADPYTEKVLDPDNDIYTSRQLSQSGNISGR